MAKYDRDAPEGEPRGRASGVVLKHQQSAQNPDGGIISKGLFSDPRFEPRARGSKDGKPTRVGSGPRRRQESPRVGEALGRSHSGESKPWLRKTSRRRAVSSEQPGLRKANRASRQGRAPRSRRMQSRPSRQATPEGLQAAHEGAAPSRSCARRCRRSSPYANVMQIPRLEKIIAQHGRRRGYPLTTEGRQRPGDLAMIAGQKPVQTRSAKSIATFKVREGMALAHGSRCARR